METEPKAKLVLDHLDFFYGDRRVLRDVNLSIPENGIFAIFGPANSGTTTLLRALNRLSDLSTESRSTGRILLDGKDIRDPGQSVTELRRRIGMVFDVPVPLPMSIYDNLAYGPRRSGVRDRATLDAKVEDALRRSVLWDEVKDRLDAPATRLSGGQQQRLCIARILALEPEVIVLDRPCAALDPVSTGKIEESLQLLKERITIVIAPHSIQQTARVSDRAAFLLSGSLIEEGPTSRMFANPQDSRTSDYLTGRFG